MSERKWQYNIDKCDLYPPLLIFVDLSYSTVVKIRLTDGAQRTRATHQSLCSTFRPCTLSNRSQKLLKAIPNIQASGCAQTYEAVE